MKEKMLSAGLKVPKVSLSARADDVYPSEQVTIKVEGTRHHMYSEAELDAYVKRIASESVGDEAVAEAAKEGWWVIGEALRSSKKDTDERDHNSLVARNPIVCTLDQQTLATEVRVGVCASRAVVLAGDWREIVDLGRRTRALRLAAQNEACGAPF